MSTPPPVAESLARIEVKLDLALKDTADHEERIRALESRRWPRPAVNLILTGAATMAGLVALLEPLLK